MFVTRERLYAHPVVLQYCQSCILKIRNTKEKWELERLEWYSYYSMETDSFDASFQLFIDSVKEITVFRVLRNAV